MNDRNFFENLVMPYYDENIIYDIYATDSFCISNVANQCYAIFFYPDNYGARFAATKYGICGILITLETTKSIINNPESANSIRRWDKKTFSEHAVFLDKNALVGLRKLKDRNDISGPSNSIDLEMEKRLIGNRKSK